MNVNTSIVRAAGLVAFALSLSGALASAQTDAPPAERADQPPAPMAGAAGAEQPIEKFDLAAALMAPGGGLTADDAGKRARARAPQIFAARASAMAAQTDVEGSWVNFVPVIDLMAQYKRIKLIRNRIVGEAPAEAPPINIDDIQDPIVRGILRGFVDSSETFTQPIHNYLLSASAQYSLSDVFLRAWPAYKATVSTSEAQKTQVEVAESMVDLTARNAFYDYARALAQRAVEEQAVKQAEAQSAQIKLFVDAGTSAPVDHMTATARLEEARSALAVAQGRVEITRTNLATWMGVKLEDIGGIAEPVLEPPAAPKDSVDDLLRTAYERRAELRALRKIVEANEHLRVAQRGSAMPQLILGASDLYAQPNPRYIPPNRPRDGKPNFKNSWEVSVSLAWHPNNSVTGYYNTQKAAAQAAKARADLGAQEDSVRMEVINAYRTYTSAEAVFVASRARLAAAEEAYRVRLATYRVGAGVIVDLLNADLAVSQARLALANSAIATRAALAALRRAAGLDLQQPR